MKTMKKLLTLITASMFAVNLNAQNTARVQAIHNSADAAASMVDVWLKTNLGSQLLIDDFGFRTATPFIDAPAGTPITLAIAPSNSTTINDTIPGLSATYNLVSGETYVLIAEGIVSTSGYTPSIPFGISVYSMGREQASTTGNTDVLVHHGSTDAPTIDVRERNLATTVVDNASYGDFAGYLELPNADYILDIQNATGSVTVASYQAPLATLGLADSALVVVASGFLNPANNSNGPAFGLWVALPSGGSLIQLPTSTPPTARVNIIHNSADAAASVVDVWLNGTLAINDFTFRTATGFIDLPATTPLQVAIAPSNSTTINDTIPGLVFNGVNFGINEKYVVIANGIVTNGNTYSPNNTVAPFDFHVYSMGREVANTLGNTDVLVYHGATDAPTVDVDEITAGNLVDDASYADFAGYLELPTNDYVLQVKNAAGTQVVKSYDAPLATLNLDDSALVVLASGFLNPAANNNGPAFGLFVALSSGGALIPLPESTTSGINEDNIVSITVYPNPAQDFIKINGLSSSFVDISIIDVSGRIVWEANQYTNDVIDVSMLSNGYYQLMINDVGNILQTKFVKQ